MPRRAPDRKPTPLFNQAELVAIFEVTSGTMSKWLKGLEPDEDHGNIKRYTMMRALRYIQGQDLDPVAERARLSKEQADREALANGVRRGELLEAATVLADWSNTFTEIKTSLMALPRKQAPLLAPITDLSEIEHHIERDIRDALRRAGVDEKGPAPPAPTPKAKRKRVGRRVPKAKPGSERGAGSVGNP